MVLLYNELLLTIKYLSFLVRTSILLVILQSIESDEFQTFLQSVNVVGQSKKRICQRSGRKNQAGNQQV